jgi:D-alanyl-D-alanine carboxypeptidase/D-alanyl-D-alanine-endopeptidase (penicillin-binding protein 4)
MLNYNRVNFAWKHNKSGWLTQMNAEGARFTPQVHMAQIQVVDRDTPLFTYRAEPGKERWTVAATALAKDGSRWLPMRQPGPYVAEVFATLCAAHGIVLPNADITQSMPDGANELCRNQSEALPEVLRKMLKYSTNLTAEAVGLAASGAGDLAGSAQAMDDWAARRFGADVRMQDHSGLNPGSRVTARQMVQIVHGAQSIAKNIAFSGLLRQTEVKDANDQKIKDTPLKIQAKSGTLNFVSGLAGYVTGKAGHKATSTATAKSGTAKSGLCFAIFAADPDRRAAIPMQEREDPKGGSAWSKRARRLQGQLISQWSRAFL